MPPVHKAPALLLAAKTLDAFKLARGCTDCGYRGHPAALHFDHVDPQTKREDLGWRRDRSKLTSHRRLLAYLDHVERYCEVRCANCHAVRTVAEKHWITRTTEPDKGPATLF